jgi:hypothetical protein
MQKLITEPHGVKWAIYRNLLKYAAGHGECAHCHVAYGDASEIVLLTDTADRTIQLCAACYGRPIGSFVAGSVTVVDGRELFPKHTRKNEARARHAWRWVF